MSGWPAPGPARSGLPDARRALGAGQADALVYDALVSNQILSAAARRREDASSSANAAASCRSPQDDITALLVRLAREGRGCCG